MKIQQLLLLLGGVALVLSPAFAQLAEDEEIAPVDLSGGYPTSFFSDISRDCEGIYREGLSFPVKTDLLKEASGLAVSRKHPNVFWSHNDGSPQKLHAVTTNPGQEGLVVSELTLPDYIKPLSGDGDWEDISTGECPDGSKRLCLWIADIGDNEEKRDSYFVYAVLEPPANPIVVFNDPMNNPADAVMEDDAMMEDDASSNGARKLLQSLLNAPSYLGWIVNQATSGRGVGDDAHERFNNAVNDPRHYNLNGDLRPRYSQSESGRTCESDHKFLIENFVAPNDVWVFEFKYPGEAKINSEAFSVAPDGSKFWTIEKTESSSARIFESGSLLQNNATEFYREVPVKQVGVLSPPCFASGVGCPDNRQFWSITGMDVHPKGSRVVVQTYAGPFEYRLSTPFDMSQLSAATPSGGMTTKGAEAIAYALDGMTLWQIPEDTDDVGCQVMQPLMCTFTATELP
mmetsp:Transcript_5139/g.13416  ORF Transcript_5139/g.13416 Transcript_5139/m.13416 type:complete len:458 (+) Transcript_5139:385-1758(+)